MADQVSSPPSGKPLHLTLTLLGDTSHLTVSDLVKLGQAIEALLRSREHQGTGGTPRVKWVIKKVEKDD